MKRFLLSALAMLLSLSIALPCLAFPAWSGDANGDAKINAKDVTLMMKYIVGNARELAPTADYNSDGKINAKDVTLTMKYLVGMNVLTDSLLEAKYGVSEVSFEIPDPVTDKEVQGSQFGFDPFAQDNSAAFNAAAAYLRENPGMKLKLENGIYKMGDEAVTFDGVKDCTVDGGGARFVFDFGRHFVFTGCEGLKFKNLTVDWDWNAYYLASAARVVSSEELEGSARRLTLEFAEKDAAYALGEQWRSFVYLDPDTLSMTGAPGKEEIYNLNSRISDMEQIASNLISVSMSAGYGGFPDEGDAVLIRHHTYWSYVFEIKGDSGEVVLEDVNIYGSAGVGIMISDGAHDVRMTRLCIGLDPDGPLAHRISTTADAIHIKDTKGHIILEDSEIGFCGDDCLNIHDNVGVVREFYENTLVIHTRNTPAFRVGDTLSFRRANDFGKIGFTAVVTGRSDSDTDLIELTLDRNCEDELEETMIVSDDTLDSAGYIIRNCTFRQNRARGILAGSSDGLIENCTFIRTRMQAIKLPVDVTEKDWTEGKGASNVIIRNNVFESCNIVGDTDGACISVIASCYAAKLGTVLGECFTDVLISGNRFIDCPGLFLSAMSMRNLTVYGNTVLFPEAEPNGFNAQKSSRISILGTCYDDSRIFGNTWRTTALTPADFEPVKINPSARSTITVEKNTVKEIEK